MWAWVKIDPTALRYVALSPDAKALAQDMYQALWSFLVCVTVTFVVSMLTKPKPDSELVGLVYGQTVIPHVVGVPVYQKPIFWAAVVGVIFVILNIIFW
jgi:SSS family solute:Na+ symporter